jgi:DNA-binding Xre family transcriptional regulator
VFKSNLADKMKKQEVTVRELVKQTGLSLQTVTNARGEKISSCSLKTLAKIAKALGCAVKDLFDEEAAHKWIKTK